MTFEEFIGEWRGEAPYIEAQTSGSTGIPKKILLEKEFVRRSAGRTNSFFSIKRESRLHCCVAPDFIGGKMMGVRSELAGCRLTWETPSNRPLGGVKKDEEITLLAVVPSQMHHILDNLGEMPRLENVLIGGSAIPPELRRKIAASGLKAYESYGMTETASHIALRRIEEDEGWFETLPGIQVRADSRDCLEILFDSGERFVTNDIAELRDSGSFRILGRIDNVIVTGGRKVNPESVEKRISHLFPGEILLTSVKDEKWGEKIVLKVEGEVKREEQVKIKEHLAALLEKWEQPKEIEWGIKLQRTKNGKIKRNRDER